MADIFEIRNELGRIFDESVYKRALALRRDDAAWEVSVDVRHGGFIKRYFLDALVADGAVIEFKTVQALTSRHTGRLLHYLLLTELPAGLLVNLRPERLQHKFVNAALSRSDRANYTVDSGHWDDSIPGARIVREIILDLMADWGTSLELELYEDALTYFLGGANRVLRRVPVAWNGVCLGDQLLRFASEDVVVRLTAFECKQDERLFEAHAGRLLAHTPVTALLWVNCGRHVIRFRSLTSDRK
jgi:GxxExxY protein